MFTEEIVVPSGCDAGTYRVVDLVRSEATPIEVIGVRSAAAAARQALGMDLVRSGNPRNLQAKVYYRNAYGVMTMVRLYRKVDDR